MYSTSTRTSTYTVVDIRKTFEGFEADLRMIARRTGKWEMSFVEKLFNDVIALAESKYLAEVSIILKDSNNNPIKATKFIVNSEGTSISSDRAGGNNWENLPNTYLSVVLSHTDKWRSLTEETKKNFSGDNFEINWIDTNEDTSFPTLSRVNGQLYASNGYELQRYNYN